MPHKNYSDSFNTYAVSKLPTFRDDFSGTDNWSDTTQIGVNTSTDVIDFDFSLNDTINHQTAYDLGAGNVSDEKWVLRGKVNFSTLGTGSNNYFYVGIGDSNETAGRSTSQDFIGLAIRNSTGAQFLYPIQSNGISVPFNGNSPEISNDPKETEVWLASTDYYWEVRRKSKTLFTVTVYSDSSFSVILASVSVTVPPTIRSLRYIKIFNSMLEPSDFIGTVDNIEFWNGVERGTRTFQDDFSGLDNWSDIGTGFGVNVTTDVIDWDASDSNANNGTAYDLGSVINDNRWVLRYKLTINNLVQGTDLTASILYMGLGSAPQTTGSSTAQDFIGFRLLNNLNNLEWNIFDTNGQGLGAVGADGTFTTLPAVGTLYVEIKRTSLTTYEVSFYSDSNYTELIERRTGVTTSGTTALRYIRFLTDNTGDGTENGIQIGTIDNVEFYNDVIVVNNVIKTVPELDFDFSVSTGWVQTNTGVIVDTVDRRIEGWANAGTDRRVTYDMGANGILSEPDWTIEFEYEFSASSSPSHGIIVFSDINQDVDTTSNNDAITVVHGTSINQLKIGYVDNGDLGASLISSSGIPIVINTRYYVRAERIRNTILKISVFSDPDFTQPISGSPVFLTVPSTVDGLRYLHSQSFSQGSSLRTLTGFLDNLKVYRTQRGTDKENKWLVIG